MDTLAIAEVCHEANRALCATQGDFTQQPWNDAADWQRDSALKGVRFTLDNPGATPEAQHEAWVRDKTADGWTFGPVKDAEAKTHPCIVPYQELPAAQRAKDALFLAIVRALTE